MADENELIEPVDTARVRLARFRQLLRLKEYIEKPGKTGEIAFVADSFADACQVKTYIFDGAKWLLVQKPNKCKECGRPM